MGKLTQTELNALDKEFTITEEYYGKSIKLWIIQPKTKSFITVYSAYPDTPENIIYSVLNGVFYKACQYWLPLGAMFYPENIDPNRADSSGRQILIPNKFLDTLGIKQDNLLEIPSSKQFVKTKKTRGQTSTSLRSRGKVVKTEEQIQTELEAAKKAVTAASKVKTFDDYLEQMRSTDGLSVETLPNVKAFEMMLKMKKVSYKLENGVFRG